MISAPKNLVVDLEAGRASCVCDAIYTHVWKPRDPYIDLDHLKEVTQGKCEYQK